MIPFTTATPHRHLRLGISEILTHLSSLKSYPSTDLIAFGACPPIASKIFGFPIGNLGRTRGDVKRDAEDSLPRLLRLFVVPPTKIVETQMPDVEKENLA